MIGSVVDSLRDQTPDFIRKNVFPLIDQLVPIYEDIANDRLEFTPTPQESKSYIEKRYSCTRNLLVQFDNDTIDETSILADVLQRTMSNTGRGGDTGGGGSAGGLDIGLELTVKQLPGRPRDAMQAAPRAGRGAGEPDVGAGQELGGVASLAGMAPGLAGSTLFSDSMADVTSAVQKGIDQVTSDINSNLVSASEVEQVDQS